MCEPVSTMAALSAMSSSTMFAASLAVSTLSAGVNYMAQSQQAEAQIVAQETNAQNIRTASVDNMNEQSIDLQQRELEERASTALSLKQQGDAAQQAAATANATSESAGLSVDALLDDYDRQYAGFADAQMMQLGFGTDQIQRTREGIEAQTKSRINNVRLDPVAMPSVLGLAAEVGAGAISSYKTFSSIDPLTGDRTL